MTTPFIKNGNIFRVTDSGSLDIHETLPAETFLIRYHNVFNYYYLELVTDMVMPTKLYGETAATVERIVTTYTKRPDKNTGVLLSGEKGSGKTMTMRAIGLSAQKLDMPVLVINEEHVGETFNQFMSCIVQPCVVCFDEFDKVYDDEHQQQILTLLDGVFNSKKLFIFTCNDTYKINKHFLNRPGRMFYNIRFRGISEATINDYCNDVLKNKKHISSVHDVARTVDAFNFDMMLGLVEEMNRYNETATQAVQLMNIRPESSSYVSFKVEIKKSGVEWIAYHYAGTNPLAAPKTVIHINRETGQLDEDGDPKNEHAQVTVTPSDLVGMDPISGDILMKKDGYQLKFVREFTSDFKYDAF